MDNSTLTTFATWIWNILVVGLFVYGAFIKGLELGGKGEVAKGWALAIVVTLVCAMLVITPD